MALSAEYWKKLLAYVEGTNKRASLDSGITLRTRSEQQAGPRKSREREPARVSQLLLSLGLRLTSRQANGIT